jgi:hypothetical protein
MCVAYISFETFGSGVCESDTAMEERLQSHPFYSYAACYWGDHVRAIKDLRPDVIEFLKDQPKVEASEQALNPEVCGEVQPSHCPWIPLAPIFPGCVFGHAECLF